MTLLMASYPIPGTNPFGPIGIVEFKRMDPSPHEFVAVLCPEVEDGGYSIFALNYPGVASQGDTIDEAKANITEAFQAVLEAQAKRNEPMAYSYWPVVDIPENCQRVRIRVDG